MGEVQNQLHYCRSRPLSLPSRHLLNSLLISHEEYDVVDVVFEQHSSCCRHSIEEGDVQAQFQSCRSHDVEKALTPNALLSLPSHRGFEIIAEPCKLRLLEKVLMESLHTRLMKLHKSDGGKWHQSCDQVIGVRLCAILSRSKEVLKDFGEFYCLRLVLDDHSPLASFFIDFFSHLEFLLLQLGSILYQDPWYQSADIVHLKLSIDRSLRILRPVTSTCRLLYATCNMLPRMISAPHLVGQTADEEIKRKGQRHGRHFSSNLPHSRMQHIAYVSLDQPGCSRVKLVEELGNGASATVYKGIFELPPADSWGHLQRPGQSVAVKMFKGGGAESGAGSSYTAPTSSFGSQLLQSMQQMTHHDQIRGDHDNIILEELEKMVVAKHPNIVTPMGYIGKRKEGECGLVMELMDETLSDHLQKVGNGSIPPLEEVKMLDLMLEIARGMRFLHECELIHLDLKPSNVLLRFNDRQNHPPEVKIADLGLTTLSSLFQKKMNGCHEEAMVPLGTSCYMAPELRSSSNVNYDDKVDVFSFGTTCFNILIGNPDACAFSGTIKHFYAAIETREWEEWMQGRNPFVVKLIRRCWQKDPSMRPTFAMLCVLLQNAIEICCMVPDTKQLSSRFLAFISGWLEEQNDVREPDHLRVYAAISRYLDGESSVAPTNFDVMERSVLQFESHINANASVLSLDNLTHPWMENLLKQLREYDNEKDKQLIIVRTCTECEKSLEIEGSSKGPKEAEDPLTFLKVQAYVNLLTLNSGGQEWRVGDLSSLMRQPSRLFSFSKDAAHAPLQVDTSLISSLVTFWKVLPPYKAFPRASIDKASQVLPMSSNK